MSKYSPEFKEKLVREYHESDIGITSLANRHGLSAGMLQSWYQRYRVHGAQAFKKKYSVYSAKFKLSVLRHMKKINFHTGKQQLILICVGVMVSLVSGNVCMMRSV